MLIVLQLCTKHILYWRITYPRHYQYIDYIYRDSNFYLFCAIINFTKIYL